MRWLACGSARILVLLSVGGAACRCAVQQPGRAALRVRGHEGHNSMPRLLSDACAHERAEETASRQIMARSVGDRLGVYEVTATLRGSEDVLTKLESLRL